MISKIRPSVCKAIFDLFAKSSSWAEIGTTESLLTQRLVEVFLTQSRRVAELSLSLLGDWEFWRLGDFNPLFDFNFQLQLLPILIYMLFAA